MRGPTYTGTGQLKVYDSPAKGTLIATATNTVSDTTGAEFSYVDATFNFTGVTLTANTSYYFELTNISNASTFYLWQYYSAGDLYSDGGYYNNGVLKTIGPDPMDAMFTITYGSVDTTAPTLLSSTPADNATNVAVSSNIVLTFNEAVSSQTGNITIKKTSDDTTVETIDVTSGLVTGTGTATITINPASDFAGSTEYYVQIDGTAFDDLAGNSYAGISSTTSLSFTTADIGEPTLSSSTPANNATNVAVNSSIVLTFNEAVNVQTGNILIKKTSDDTTIETIDVTSGLVTGTGTTTITINPATDLVEDLEYYVLIDATAFDDLSGDSYAGISSTTALSFMTISTALPNPLEDKEVLGLIKAQTDTVVRVAGQSMRSVNGRLTQLIFSPRDSLANNSHQGIRLSMADTNLNGVLSSTGLMSGLNSSADIFNNGWAIWTEGSVVLGKGRGDSDFNIGGITIGVDKRITPMLTTGIALRAAQEDSDVGIASSIDTNSYSATAYGSYALNNSTYIQGALGYSGIDISSMRVSNADVFKGSRDAEQVYMSLSLTKQFEYRGLTLLPYGAFDGSYSTLDEYSEKGAGAALTYHKQHIKTLAATLGLRGNYVIQQSYGLLVPRFHVNYQGDVNSDSSVAVNYVSIPSTTYKTSFDGISSSSWLLGLGLDYQLNNLNFSADYERTEQINWGHIDTFRLMLNATF